METTTDKSNKRFNSETKEAKRRFLILNVLLFLGAVLIVSSLLYILFNLNQSDRVIYKSMVFLVTGLILVFFYAISSAGIRKRRHTYNQRF